jgi:hypothetical protein
LNSGSVKQSDALQGLQEFNFPAHRLQTIVDDFGTRSWTISGERGGISTICGCSFLDSELRDPASSGKCLPAAAQEEAPSMKGFISGICCVLVVAGFAFAADNQDRKGQGYVFFATGGATGGGRTDAVMHFGLGGEGVLYKGLGLGGEIGYLYPTVSASSGIAIVSINALYQFGLPTSTRKTVPFITGGWSIAVRDSAINGANIGGGVTYWFRRRLGLRMEFRDHFAARDITAHIWEGRVGLSF